MAKILIIDDSEPFRRAVRRSLQNAGHEVSEAPNGSEGLGMFLDDTPDLVIIDLFMPEKEGLETIVELKRLNPKARLIAVSGDVLRYEFDFLQVAQYLGASRVLAKPFDDQDLLSVVDAVLQGDDPGAEDKAPNLGARESV